MNPLKKTDPLLTDPMQSFSMTSQASPASKCGKLHVRPSETDIGLNLTVRELAIHWSLHQGPTIVSDVLMNYAKLLRKTYDNEQDSLFRQVILEMIAEQQEQNDSPNRKE